MEWTTLADGLVVRDNPLTNQSNDPRIGSSRDNSTTGTLSHVTSSGTESSSASSLGGTFIPVLVYSAVCLIIFIFFRRKNPRVYAPRTIPDILRPPETPVPALPDGWFNWIKPFWQVDEKFMLNNLSLDGYFFLRYIRVLATICFAGVLIAWPVLLSVNATGGNKLSQLDLLTIGDIDDSSKFYAHVFISWIFFGFILFMICRECIFYVNLRQAYLMAPQHANRLSARTVLFTCVPKHFLDEHRIRKLYGDSVKNVWIPRNTRALQRLVEERQKTAERLEKAEIALIRKAHAARTKQQSTKALPRLLGVFGKRPKSIEASTSLPVASPSPASPPLSSSASSSSSSSNSSTSSSSPPSLTSSSSSSSVVPGSAAPPAEPPTPAQASTAPVMAAPGPSVSLSTNDLQNSLSPGLIQQINDINETNDPGLVLVKGKSQDARTSGERHGSFSEAPSSPSTTIVVPVSIPMSDITKADVEAKEKGKDAGAVLSGREVAAGDEDEDEENEADYVHPYGYASTLPDVRGSVAAQWLKAENRPRHRPLANFGRSVDTIRWTRMQLKTLNQNIARMRRRFRNGDGDFISSVFVEFDSQAAAQVAYQVLSHHQPLHMSPRYIGIRPEEVLWHSLRIRWWERIIRRFFIMGAVTAGIIMWSVPSAFVGIVSNVQFLSTNVFFLHWLVDLPGAIEGVIAGLLPAVVLSLLMAAVPSMMRVCARAAGIPSTPMVELFTQNAYFGFQVVQVFLVTTLTSAASAAFTSILQDPLSAKDLLSQNLPKASNFYLSYITVQCLAGSAIGLVHILDLFRHGVLARTIQNPRRAAKLWHRLKQPHWGGIYPVFTNMGVIAISYTCIAPLILAFAAIGMCCTYQVYKYNLLYAYGTDRDSKGLHYPRGLLHLMIGLYLAEICLIGLFSIQSAIGPVVMMVLFLIFTCLVHMSLNDAVSPLLYSLPRTLALDDKDLAAGHYDLAEQEAVASSSRSEPSGGLAADYYDLEEGYGEEEDPEDALHSGPSTTRGIDGASDLMGIVKEWGREALKKKVKSEAKAISEEARTFSFSSYVPSWVPSWVKSTADVDKGPDTFEVGPDGQPKKTQPNFFIRWLHPELYEDYTFLRKMLSADPPPIEYPPDYAQRGYWPPEMWTRIPHLWIPKDEGRVSRQEVAHSRKVVPTTDRGAWLTPKGDVAFDLTKAPFIEPRYLY